MSGWFRTVPKIEPLTGPLVAPVVQKLFYQIDKKKTSDYPTPEPNAHYVFSRFKTDIGHPAGFIPNLSR